MAELGTAYQLIGPDGTRVVIGNCDDAMNDPDFIGFLDPESGITGLLDTADVREQAGDLVEVDGGWHGPFYEGRRPGTLQGVLLPNADLATVLEAERRLKRATRALRADTIMRWTPTGQTIERELRLRRQSGVRITGRWPKAWQVALVSAEPHVLSSTEEQLTITPDQAIAVVGFTSPFTSAFSTTAAATGAGFATNQGDVETWPRFLIHGPITNPEVLNNTTAETVRFNTDLAADQFIVVDAEHATVLFGADAGGGLANRYSFYDFAASSWWRLRPGVNDVRLLSTAYSAGAYLTTYWRHAWE